MSWKKWMVALATVVTTTQFAPANASDCYECDSGSDCGFSLCDCDPCEGWSVYADYLYWRVRRCDPNYAFIEDPDVIYGVYSVSPSYDSGFRVGVLKACGDVDFGVHYTYFKSEDSDYVTRDEEFSALGQTRLNGSILFVEGIDLAGADYRVELNQLDLELGYHLEISDCLAARLFTGFRYANIKQELDVVYAEDRDDVLGVSSLNAVDFGYFKTEIDFYGLYLGNKASYKVSDCFDFFGGFSLGIGVGEVEQNYHHFGTNGGTEYVDLDYFDGSCWKALGVLDLNVGVTFPLCNVCCTDWALSFGYEFHHWFNTSSFVSLDTEDKIFAHIDSHCCDLGFDGLFVRLSAAF